MVGKGNGNGNININGSGQECPVYTLSNGDLLTEAERAGFDVLLTADKNIQYQQNLTGRRIALVLLSILEFLPQ